jgi:hypothetical protein
MTQAFDYSDSAPFDMELIPSGEVALVQMRIRAGDGVDGVLKRARNGQSEYLDAEFVLLDGKHARLKFWQNLLLAGETDGHKQMIAKSNAIMKAMLDSAYGIDPNDKSPEARAKRSKTLRDFDGIRFQAKIGIEKGKKKDDGSNETYRDRNILDGITTPDKPGYRGPFEQGPSPSGGPSSSTPPSSAPISKPGWAQ